MADVASRELRNNTRAVLDRVEGGEDIRVTVDGRPVAILIPVDRRRSTMRKGEFLRRLADAQADPALREELRAMLPDTTDDLP